ncbi:M1 family metallopeptidase [Tepidibacter thalassicus]|uniref:Peptidase family M1 n=1 Tax=Tepidibacter thalassicus DSM 15285 TaxID=1123350 RepID=A0A1M5TNU0_9FIRM|nr:M1 family metallopeptidase [Tepidibacter thalassicus]SHH52306.1 Peptidase family M1 [Tepidibacter thalassicus DSM 15285]
MVLILNKKKVITLISVLSVFFLVFAVLIDTNLHIEVFKKHKADNLNMYLINVSLNDKEKILKCSQNITYVNKTGKNLKKLYFHIYPNAFSKEEYAPFEKNEFKKAYPNGFSKGYINIRKVFEKKYNLDFKIVGEKEDILEVDLRCNLKPGEKTNIYLEYDVKLPNSIGRFGYGDYTINITNWYPIVCVYDSRGWNIKSYEEIGDPFYSDVSNFDVNINIPKKYKLATTGIIKSKKLNNDYVLYNVKGNNVRDFAFILSDKFNVISTKLKDIKVYSYFFDEKLGRESLQIAKDALTVFSDLFGEYPYKTYSVVASDFFIGGMEYPNLVMIDKTLYKRNSKFFLEYVVAHETAHQWWYSLVGNDEISEPWLDESLTEYSTIIYFEKKYGKEIKDRLIKNLKINTYRKSNKSVFKSTTEFENSIDYSLCVYSKGALLLDDIRNKVGDDAFFDTLRKYYKQNMYKNVTSEKFINMWKKRGVNIDKMVYGNN